MLKFFRMGKFCKPCSEWHDTGFICAKALQFWKAQSAHRPPKIEFAQVKASVFQQFFTPRKLPSRVIDTIDLTPSPETVKTPNLSPTDESIQSEEGPRTPPNSPPATPPASPAATVTWTDQTHPDEDPFQAKGSISSFTDPVMEPKSPSFSQLPELQDLLALDSHPDTLLAESPSLALAPTSHHYTQTEWHMQNAIQWMKEQMQGPESTSLRRLAKIKTELNPVHRPWTQVAHMAQVKDNLAMKFPAMTALKTELVTRIDRGQKMMRPHLQRFLVEMQLDPKKAQNTDWFAFLLHYAKGRGRCGYGNGERGICPKTAKLYTRTLQSLLIDDYEADEQTLIPIMSRVSRLWKKDLTSEMLYKRAQAPYFSAKHIRQYLQAFDEIVADKDTSVIDRYYAKMAACLLSITITQAGCRMGELLATRPEQLYFGEVSEGRIAVAIRPSGSKTDAENQRTTPISFIQIQETDICPVKRFVDWLQFNDWKFDGHTLLTQGTKFLFPLATKKFKHLPTANFTQRVSQKKFFCRPLFRQKNRFFSPY